MTTATAKRRAPPRKAEPEATPVDLGPLPRLTGYALRRAQLAVFDDFLATFAPLGLRPASFSVLLVIQRNPGRKQSEIAAALGIQQANFVGLMDELAARGLAVRTRLPDDRRSHALTLTADGEALLARALAILDKHEKRMIANLGPGGHDRLLDLLGRFSGAGAASD